jgi:hypothetical protein
VPQTKKTSPARVISTRRCDRRKRATPSSSSSCLSWTLREGWETCSYLPACRKLKFSATATKYRTCRSSMADNPHLFRVT